MAMLPSKLVQLRQPLLRVDCGFLRIYGISYARNIQKRMKCPSMSADYSNTWKKQFSSSLLLFLRLSFFNVASTARSLAYSLLDMCVVVYVF